MAKNRMINTHFWVDSYISELLPLQKFLFLYFLTNPLTDISGVYEIPLRNIVFDTGLEKTTIEEYLKKFSDDNKIHYTGGWLAIVNFAKHQLDNPKVQTGIKNGFARAPKEIMDRLKLENLDYHRLSHINTNTNLNINTNTDYPNGVKNPLPVTATRRNGKATQGEVRTFENGVLAKFDCGQWIDMSTKQVFTPNL